MKTTVRMIIIGAIVTAFALFVAAKVWMDIYLPQPTDLILRLEYLKFSLEVYKAIGLGFLITLLGVAIPNILPEARYEFETSKEWREKYSKVKTGIVYLNYKLADLKFSDALVHIENLHRQKHLAEMYPQPAEKLAFLKKEAYYTLQATFNQLTKQADWDSLSRNERLERLAKVEIPNP